MDNFTGDKVHFETMSGPSEGPKYRVEKERGLWWLMRGTAGIVVGDKDPLNEVTANQLCDWLNNTNDNLMYLEGRQSMQAKVDKANQRWEKLKEFYIESKKIHEKDVIYYASEVLKKIDEMEKP